MLELRCDIKALATVARFFRANNIPINSRGGLAREAVETFAAWLIESKKVQSINTAEEALSVLIGFGLVGKDQPIQIKADLLKQLADESEQQTDRSALKKAIEIAASLTEEDIERQFNSNPKNGGSDD
ncbi:hypothetical protein KKH13_04655 [Patescibacteria group bacterium]|nr:hypothetical protein [Patescibacteria group bacterium]